VVPVFAEKALDGLFLITKTLNTKGGTKTDEKGGT
jgi:hypothetical protein